MATNRAFVSPILGTNLYKSKIETFIQQQNKMAAWENELADEPAFKGLLMAKKEHQKELAEYKKQKKNNKQEKNND
ncbi:MAG: hypothetical protein V7744_04125 [Pseudomonadales bacterium]